MIRHVVVFTWLAEATADQKAEATAALVTLPPLMKGLRSYTYGPDVGLTAGNAAFAIVADFDDTESYMGYRDNPVHQDIIKRLIVPIVAERRAVQFEV
ncbi:MAG: Dabb family protein [Streptosporangiaceae bacterium]